MSSRAGRRVRNITITLLLLGLAAWIVPSYFSAERYRRRLQAGLEQALHRPVKFGALSFHLIPRPGFSIEDAEVDEDPDFGSEPFARVDRIDCDLRWHSLWQSSMDFARLHLDHPSFNVVLNPQGKWNVEKLLLQSGVTTPPGVAKGALRVTAERLDLAVNSARVNFQVGPNKKPFALTDVEALLQIEPAQGRVQFQITASPVRSDLTIPTPGPVEASGTWEPRTDLRGPLDARLHTRGALLYDWIPVVTGENPQVYGVIDSDVRLTGSLPDLVVEGETQLSQMHRWEELPPSDPMPWTIHYRGRVVRGRERILIESMDASFADSHLHLSGSLDDLQSGPQMDLVMSLERSRLEDVIAVFRRFWPNSSPWNLKGRVDAMLAIQGPWKERRYGGFIGARQTTLETPAGSYPLSEIAARISNRGIVLAPVQVTLAPHVALSAQASMDRTNLGTRYEVQLSAKNVALHEAVLLARGLGIHAVQEIDATGSGNASLVLTGTLPPATHPLLTGHAEIRAARLLIPGLTEPLNLPRASAQINGNQITVDPIVAVLGTSVFRAKLVHRGVRSSPWEIDLDANSLRLEQAALWFDVLGLRRPVPLLERLPGLSSFAARREAATQVFGSLNAKGRFSTPALIYRTLTLGDFQGEFEVGGRTVLMTAAKFRAAGGRGEANGTADFTASPPRLSAKASITGLPLQSFAGHLPGPVRGLRGLANAAGSFQTRGLTREEMAENLTGQMEGRLKDLSFGEFDPLERLAEQARWGKLESARAPLAVPPVAITAEVHDRHIIMKTGTVDLGGASLLLNGDYGWAGSLNLDVRADLRHLRRRWLVRDDDSQPTATLQGIRLGGPLDHLVIIPQDGVASVGTSRGGERVR